MRYYFQYILWNKKRGVQLSLHILCNYNKRLLILLASNIKNRPSWPENWSCFYEIKASLDKVALFIHKLQPYKPTYIIIGMSHKIKLLEKHGMGPGEKWYWNLSNQAYYFKLSATKRTLINENITEIFSSIVTKYNISSSLVLKL
jgi:hypothetical protein